MANNTSLVMQWCQGKIQLMLTITWHDTCLIAEDAYETTSWNAAFELNINCLEVGLCFREGYKWQEQPCDLRSVLPSEAVSCYNRIHWFSKAGETQLRHNSKCCLKDSWHYQTQFHGYFAWGSAPPEQIGAHSLLNLSGSEIGRYSTVF